MFLFQVKDQQEAERKKVTSQEIQQALKDQTKVITEKQSNVKADLAQVEPAVIEAQNGISLLHVSIFDFSKHLKRSLVDFSIYHCFCLYLASYHSTSVYIPFFFVLASQCPSACLYLSLVFCLFASLSLTCSARFTSCF